jgi:hypothetical protein
VRELLAAKADVNKLDSKGNSVLLLAARSANLDLLKELMNAGSDLLLTTQNQELENTVIHKISRDTRSKTSFEKIIHNNYQGLNLVAKLELLRAFSFISDNYDKFSQFLSKETIEAVKASLEVIDYINELTKLIRFDMDTAEGRHALDEKVRQLQHITEHINKYTKIGIVIDKYKIQKFIIEATNAVNRKYANFKGTIKSSIKALIPKEEVEDSNAKAEASSSASKPLELTDLPNEIFAKIFSEVLLENRIFKQNPVDGEAKLICATDLLCDMSKLNDHLKELGASLANFE